MADLPDYHVLGDQIRQDTTLNAAGTGIQTVYVVPYVVDSGPAQGSTQSIEVAPDDFTGARVGELIDAHLNNVHQVAALGRGARSGMA